MTGIEPLIRSIVPNPVYSETFSEFGAPVNPGSQRLQHDFRDRGAKVILIHSIICSVRPDIPVAPNQCTVRDNFNKILMQFFIHTSMGGAYAFGHVIIASEINLSFTGPAVGMFSVLFTVQYQYVYDAESKVLKR